MIGILRAYFRAIEQNLAQVKIVIQRLVDIVGSIETSCTDLINWVTKESIDQLESNITKQVAKLIVDINERITNYQTT